MAVACKHKFRPTVTAACGHTVAHHQGGELGARQTGGPNAADENLAIKAVRRPSFLRASAFFMRRGL